jgi:peptidoglycan/LPS O-acetylase OafA/YrhL
MSKDKAGFRADAEGLRGLAVLAVVLFHAGLPGFRGGYVGVDVFYVLSGFLITGLLWGELQRTGRISFAGFYGRRARRLLPAAVLVLVATVVAAYVVLSPLQARSVCADALSAALYVANYRFALLQTDYLASGAGPSPIQHYWSLGVEEQFYLLWPLLLFAVRPAFGRRLRRKPRPIGIFAALLVVTAISFVLSLRLTGSNEPWAFFSLPTRAWELGVGGLVALAVPLLRRLAPAVAAGLAWSGLAAVVAGIVLLSEATPFPGMAALLPVLGAGAVLAGGSATGRSGPTRLLGAPPLLVAGRLSYAWYLWHWPLLVLPAAAAGHPLPLQAKLALVVVSAALAAATVELVENPVRFAPRLVASPARSLRVAGVLTAVAVAVPLAVTGAVAARPAGRVVQATTALPSVVHVRAQPSTGPTTDPLLATVQNAVAAGVQTVQVPGNLDPSLDRANADRAAPFVDGCNITWTAVYQPTCSYGATAGPHSVVLLGDSHAAQWEPGLRLIARQRGWQLHSWTKATCPPLELDVWSPVLHRPYRECAAWRAAMLDRIRQQRPDLVVLGVARHYGPEYKFSVYSPAWIDGLQRMVEELRATGTRVVVMGPTPHPKSDVPDCLSAHPDDARRCTQPLSKAVDAAGLAAERAVVEKAGGRYVDISPWVCTSTTCAVVVGNLLVYRDDNHLTTEYPRWLAPLLGEAVGIV